MQKVFLYIIMILFSFNISYAEPFSISRVQKTAGVPLSEMNYDLPYKDVITDYDYSKLNDKAKIKKANEFLLKLNRKAKYLRNADTDSMNKDYAYFLAFHRLHRGFLNHLVSLLLHKFGIPHLFQKH